MPWGFYGRTNELHRLQEILGRNRWFFVKSPGAAASARPR
jgi:hypothetical protein